MTAEEIIDTMLPEPYRRQALSNIELYPLNPYEEVKDVEEAIINGFNRYESKEGISYWVNAAIMLKKYIKQKKFLEDFVIKEFLQDDVPEPIYKMAMYKAYNYIDLKFLVNKYHFQ